MSDLSASARTPRLAVYAGVFDPPTMAHLEIIESALHIFDELMVLVSFNPNKAGALFSPEERVELLEASLTPATRSRVRVAAFHGLTAPYAESLGACALVRGMRPYADADHEIGLALMNQALAPRLPTVLLFASAKYVHMSSSFVRETATLGGMIVPGSVSPPVEEALRRRFGRQLSVTDGAPSQPAATSTTPSVP
ncbi:MAG: pantetheine-phosphate adenylyltransferase [Chloroflexota bacterium]|nr:pantetheine-phosphate adenylyltransferase [Chloroflexota bacterium]